MKKLINILLSLVLVLFFVVGASSNSTFAKNEKLKLKVFVHYPKNYGKPVPSTCEPTTNDKVEDFLLAGWHMPTSGMTYKINYASRPQNLSEPQVYQAISSSFNTWASADLKQIFIYNGSTSATAGKYDGVNAIAWKKTMNFALAITYAWYYTNTGELSEADTVFNSRYKWSYTSYDGTNDCGGVSRTYDLQNIGTHEFGHWVGLDDLYSNVDKDLTMYGYGDTIELKKDSLGLGDINGVNAVAP